MTNRGKNTIINIIVIVVMQVTSLFYALISKRFFLNYFSISVYGVVDLFGSFFRSLMMLELGFGSILIFNLYKPISCNDEAEIRRQLSLFKTVYAIISLVILCISVVSLPFIYKVFNITYEDKLLVYEIYILNIFSILIKYYFLNKISILNAGQTNYVQNISVIITDFLSFLLKMASLLLFENIYVYIFSLLFIPSLSYIIQSKWIDRHYNVCGIKYAKISEIKDSEILNQMNKYIYATIYNLVFFGMDNIIISIKLSTDAIAYVSNYLSLINIGGTFIETISLSLRGIVADYKFRETDNNGFFLLFKYISILCFFMTSIITVGFFTMIDDFISLWIGADFLIDNSLLIVLILLRLIDSVFEPIASVFNICGYIFYEKYPLIFSALANLLFTIIFIEHFGLIGAYLGTLVAIIIKWIGKFYYILNGVFRKYRLKTVLMYLAFIIVILFEMFAINCFVGIIMSQVNSLILFIKKIILVILTTCTIDFLLVIFDKDTRLFVGKVVKNYFEK